MCTVPCRPASKASPGFDAPAYSAVIEPRLARLKLSSDWRILQTLTVPQIAKAVLKAHGLNHRRDKTVANHRARIGGNQDYTVEGHSELQAGESIVHRTKDYELHAGDEVVINGPRGTIRIDGARITLDAMPCTSRQRSSACIHFQHESHRPVRGSRGRSEVACAIPR
ncbi:contractile injection system protein, VgrG/Pvc8 family [Pseudomonas chlororaphis]|nr:MULTISPECIES: contractile injection system protein, VgrG/Pvc8 family [Pseudomonas]WJV25550.1 contractile injection system protein, VgrG/Pvc8 family [Pseudomonas chlororaphis]